MQGIQMDSAGSDPSVTLLQRWRYTLWKQAVQEEIHSRSTGSETVHIHSAKNSYGLLQMCMRDNNNMWKWKDFPVWVVLADIDIAASCPPLACLSSENYCRGWRDVEMGMVG